MKPLIPAAIIALTALCCMSMAGADEMKSRYVGSETCRDCHVQQYDNFSEYASKYRSDRNVQLMMNKLTPQEQQECYECHTTGYGKPGGFVSFEETPQLGHAGCEVCHGPGSKHALTGDPGMITSDLTVEEHCAPCHDDQRVRRINYKPLLHSGAH